MREDRVRKERNINYISLYGYFKYIPIAACICLAVFAVMNTINADLSERGAIFSFGIASGYILLMAFEKGLDNSRENPSVLIKKTYVLEENKDGKYIDIEWIQDDNRVVCRASFQINGEKWLCDDNFLDIQESNEKTVRVIYGLCGVKGLTVYCPRSVINEHSELSPLKLQRLLIDMSVEDLVRRTKIPYETLLKYDAGEMPINNSNELSVLCAALDCEQEDLLHI